VQPAPIALFVYNRPEHTRRTLESLAANELASQSRLIIFSDGPKPGEEAAVARVREVVRERAWCGEVEVRESAENRGLAANIVSGVTAVLSESDCVITLEDDLELSPGFLAYMNDALSLYADDAQVLSVSGWMPALGANGDRLPETFFLRTTGSWGWATWRRAWAHYQPDATKLAREIEAAGQVRAFNLGGAYDYFTQLRNIAEGRHKAWATVWYGSIFMAGGLNLHPRCSLVRNIGLDGSGTHCEPDARFGREELADRIAVTRTPLEVNEPAQDAFRRHLRGPLSQRVRDSFHAILGRFRGARK